MNKISRKTIKKYFPSPFLVLAAMCFLLAVGSFLLAGNLSQSQKQAVRKEETIRKEKNEAISKPPVQQSVESKIITPAPLIPTSSPVQRQSLSNPVPAPTPTPVPSGLKVLLTINGSSAGSVNVSSGANQCDVLSQALSEGGIKSLNMRYNSDLGTYGVYQINGIGQENAVWWVYKVNGQSPNQGCSFIKVNNGDSVEWSYLGK